MQVEVSRQEMIMSLVDIADRNGQASFVVDGDELVKCVEYCGFSFDFVRNRPARLRTRTLDVVINLMADGISGMDGAEEFPVWAHSLSYLRGNDEVLQSLYHEVEHLAPRKMAA